MDFRNQLSSIESKPNGRAYSCGILVAESWLLHRLGELRYRHWYVCVKWTLTGYRACNRALACCILDWDWAMGLGSYALLYRAPMGAGFCWSFGLIAERRTLGQA